MNNPQTPPLFPDEQIEHTQSEKASSPGYFSPALPKLKPIDRRQMFFRSVEIEELIPQDHEARAIWEFVGRLDLSCYYGDIRSMEGGAGRPALDPQLMISLWIYSYSKGVSSGRQIAELCEFDPAYQWLTGMTLINHHTLSDFRVDHKESLDTLFVEVLGFLSSEELITMERVMQDGTKIKGFAKRDSFKREDRIKEHLKAALEQIESLDDPKVKEEISLWQEKARLRALLEQKEKLEKALRELEMYRETKKSAKEKEEARVSETDPEARIMKQSNGGFSPSYNVQISTDAANGLIVAVGVSQAGNDTGELIPAVERIEAKTGQTPKQMVVDAGYTTKANILEMREKTIDLIGSIKENADPNNIEKCGGGPNFDSKAFSYNATEDIFTCPAGQPLRLKERRQEIGCFTYRYFPKKGVCQKCQFQKQCCPQNSDKGRSLQRTVDAPEIASFKEKMQTEEAKAIYKQRYQISEFPNAWIKEKIGLRQFRLQGLIKVGMEALWACITYNIQRWIGLKWRSRWAISKAGN